MLPNHFISADEQAELQLFTESLERFCDAEIEPHYRTWEKAGRVPRDLLRKMGENGYCWRHLNSDPPCRSNIDPGRIAEFGISNCG